MRYPEAALLWLPVTGSALHPCAVRWRLLFHLSLGEVSELMGLLSISGPVTLGRSGLQKLGRAFSSLPCPSPSSIPTAASHTDEAWWDQAPITPSLSTTKACKHRIAPEAQSVQCLPGGGPQAA